MILKASQRAGAKQLAWHLLNERDNEHVSVHELRGFVADNLVDAFNESYALSRGTRCTQFLFSLSLSPPERESVPVEMFEKAITDIEAKVGLAGQPRAIVFHEKEGRRHAHCVWSRIDPERMRAINLPHFKVKLDDNGGDLSRAIMAYRGSSDPAVNRDYLAKVMRGAGQMGDLSEAGQAREQDARTRALSQEREALRLTTEAGGRDRDTTLARIEAMRTITDAQGRGIVVTQEYAAQLGREALERRNLMSAGRLVEYRENAAFERSQLGRTESEARGASVARSLGFDPDSERGRLVMESEGLNSSLRTTKQVASEAFTGMLSDLRRGKSLVETVMNMADRMGDRFLNLASDKIISGLFSGEGKEGGGWISSAIASISGGAADGRVPAYADGKTPSVSAAGIISGPGGPRDDAVLAWVSNREAIIRASSVERYGADFIRSINEGTAPRDVVLMGRSGTPRYADGMVPSREAFTRPSRGAFAPSAAAGALPAINFINPPGVQLEPNGPPQRRADGGIDQALRLVENRLGQRMANGQGPFKRMPGGAAYRKG